MKNRPVIFYFCTQNATFIEKDLAILRSEFLVFVCLFSPKKKWKAPFLFLTQFGFLISQIFKWNQAVSICQFAGYHSFIPTIWAKLAGRKSIIIVGGTDCVSFPSLGYGHLRKGLLKWFCKMSYHLTSVVSAVHKSLFKREDNYYLKSESKQGILHFFPDAPFIQNEIPNGFDTEKFRIILPLENRKPLSFCTISSSLDNAIRMKLKGVDMILELAEKMPEASFTLIGASENPQISIPKNVTLIPYVANEALPDWYNQHRFYIQLSVSEGFPNALCEAMSAGCIPIVSKVASMPDIIGDSGVTIENREIGTIYSHVQELIASQDLESKSLKSRELVVNRFPINRRKEELIELVNSLASS